MQIPAYSLIFSIGLLLAADVTPGPEIAPQVLQGGALAILGWIVWYLLTKTFPAHTAALREQRDAFLTALQAERQETREMVNAVKDYLSGDK